MRFLPLSTITLLALLLSACGGSLDGATDSDDSVSDTETDASTVIVEEETGKASFFSYEGVSSDWITIKGVGAEGTDEAATVSFKILDANREGIEGEVVAFELLNSPAGVTLAVDSSTSDADGLVSTLIKSGSAAGSVTVKVTLVSDTSIYKTSNKLNISTGYPDQDSITLTVEEFSPEALSYVTSVGVTVYLGGGIDNTAVPDGTTVSFKTNSGRITDESGTSGACITVGSECSMVWYSTLPHSDDYRAIIIAEADGEESFTDSNDDGLFTEGEDYTDINGDGKYTGMLCPEDESYCVHSLTTISASTQVVISGSDLFCDFFDEGGAAISSIDLTAATSVTFNVSVYDENNNVPPGETSISVITGNGDISGTSSWSVPGSTSSSYDFSATINREATANSISTSNATFSLTTPKGNLSTCTIPVVDNT